MEFLKLLDDYTLEMLMDYHLGIKDKDTNAEIAYGMLINEYKFRKNERTTTSTTK